MVSLDNLVVTTALPVIKRDLGASLSGLEWTVNGYTLTFAVLLLTGAALGDRFGRKRMFVLGLAVLPLAVTRLTDTTGPNRSLDLPGLGLVSAGLFGLVFGLVRASEHGWGSLGVAGPLIAGAVLVAAFVAWELRARAPMVAMRLFRSRQFSAANATSLFMYFGMFGSIFLLAQYFQVVQGYTPLQAGLRTLPWTAMPILVAPIAGILSDRIGGRPLLVVGMSLMAGALAWLAAVITPTVPYRDLVAPFVLAGIGMSLFFAPTANVVLSAVRRVEEGKASGVNNTVREIGGVFGVAVLATVFSAVGSYASPGSFVDGLTSATWVGAAVVGLAALSALAIPGRGRLASQGEPQGEPVSLEVAERELVEVR